MTQILTRKPIRRAMDLDKYPGAKRTAMLVTCAAILQVTESFLPRLPLPGIRLGLANMITLVALVDLGFWPALEVALLRSLISSFLMGTFLSPAFILSFSSAMTSTLVMGALYVPFSRFKNSPLSLTGISLAGAAAHNLTQISVVYLILIRNQAVFMLLPWLGISAVITGFITGIVASRVCEELEKPYQADPLNTEIFRAADDPDVPGWLSNGKFAPSAQDGGMDPAYKLLACILLAAAVLLFGNLILYLTAILIILLLAAAANVSITSLLTPLCKAGFFLLFSFFVPALFNSSGHRLVSFHRITVTDAGLAEGGMFVLRLIILMISAGLLVRTTTPRRLSRGIEKLLGPFRFTGLQPDRISAIAVYSWMNLPQFWERAMVLIKKYTAEKKFGFRNIMGSSAAILVALYRHAEE